MPTADDRDSQFSYFGDWLLDGTGNPAIYLSTLSQTNQVSAGATFTFTGTQISVFGVVRQLPAGAIPPISTYKVDGGDVATYNAPNLTAGEGDNMLFFASGTLPAASHVLLINVTRVSPDAPYLLDYVTYASVASPTPSSTPTPNPAPSPSPSPTPTPSQAPSSPSTPSQAPAPAQSSPSVVTVGGTLPSSQSSASSISSPSSQSSSSASSASPAQTFAQSESHAPLLSPSSSSPSGTAGVTGLPDGASGASVRSANHVGPIVGGVIGGVILLVLIVVGALFWRRRRRNAPGPVADYYASPPTSPATREVFTTPGITPYLLSRDQPGSGGQESYSNPFDSPSDGDHANASGATPYIATLHSKSRSPDRLVPNRYGEASESPDPSIPTPSDSAYAASTEPSERGWLRAGATSPSGNSSSQGSRFGPRPPRDDVKGSISGSRQLVSRPAAQHADSGVRFGPPRAPPTEVMSEVLTEIPPAYTAS